MAKKLQFMIDASEMEFLQKIEIGERVERFQSWSWVSFQSGLRIAVTSVSFVPDPRCSRLFEQAGYICNPSTSRDPEKIITQFRRLQKSFTRPTFLLCPTDTSILSLSTSYFHHIIILT